MTEAQVGTLTGDTASGSGRRPNEARYQEIERFVRDLVAIGRPGDPLPTDQDLCDRFAVSRMTARQAMHQLQQEGLVDRKRGQGTFVAARPIHRRMGHLLSFTEDMRRRGMSASSRLLSAGPSRPDAEDLAALELPAAGLVVVVTRLRLADGLPMALERVVLPDSCAAVLDRDLEAGSLHVALTQMGRVPTVALAAVRARLSTRSEASLLEFPLGSALLVERRVIRDQHGVPIEHTETAYVADRYVFDVELHLVGDSEGRTDSAVQVARDLAHNAAPIAPAQVPTTPGRS